MSATNRRPGRPANSATTTHSAFASSSAAAMSTSAASPRASPFLPTPIERLALGLFPLLLVFGSLFALLSPGTRAMKYDAYSQSHTSIDGTAPGAYFARKSNLFNVYFVKRGWAWTSSALLVFLLAHPLMVNKTSSSSSSNTRIRLAQGVVTRWALVTGWWVLVVQWCFGAPLIDRGFRWTGGQCRVAEAGVEEGTADVGDVLTAVACKAAGGRWYGGHDISGHVFLLTLGSAMLMHEVLWPLARWAGWAADERCVVMGDGAIKGAGVEGDAAPGAGRGQGIVLGAGGKYALGVLGLNLWMLLMTAIYFHTWFEKFTGLLTAFIAIYAVYYVPRFVPLVRQIVGIPGI